MAVKRFRGKTKLMYFRKTDTTTQFKDGSFVRLDADGTIGQLLGDSDDHILGVCRMAIAAIDTAFVGAPRVPVEVPVEDYVEWDVDMDSDGTAADSDAGSYVGIDTTTDSGLSDRIDISDTAIRHFLVVGVSDTVVDKIRVVIARKASSVPGDTAIAA